MNLMIEFFTKTKTKKISALITLAFSLFFYCIRFLLVNPTISTTFNILKFIIYCATSIYLLIAISILINDLFQIINKDSNFKIVLWIKTKLQSLMKYISNKFFEMYLTLFRGLFQKLLMLPLTRLLLATALIHRVINFIFVSLPVVLISICYFIDIVIYKEFYYFPRYLILLLIPLIFSILIRCLHIETSAAIEPLDKNARFYHSSSTDPRVLQFSEQKREALFNNAYEILTLVVYAENYCKTLLQGYSEQKICLIIRHSLFLISIIHLIYYMF